MRACATVPAVLVGVMLGVGRTADAQSALAHYRLDGSPAWRAELPVALAEISGIAFAEDGRLYAHGDEQAAIHRFDLATRRPAERFGLASGGSLLHGDFEDIQVIGGRVFLVTSEGVVHESRLAGDGRQVEAARRTAGLGRACEVEGMTWDAGSKSLLLLCKQAQGKRWKGQVVILAVSPETGDFEPQPRLTVAETELQRFTGSKRFAGSAIARHPRTGTYLMVAGPQRLYAEIDSTGKVLGGGKLSAGRHRQPEGLAIAPDLTLLVSDEAAGKTATITGYAYRR